MDYLGKSFRTGRRSLPYKLSGDDRLEFNGLQNERPSCEDGLSFTKGRTPGGY
jgi:hypothetical protein